METKVLSEQTLLTEERLYNEKKLVTERPIEGIKNPGEHYDLITGSPFDSLGDNYGHGNNVEGIDISNPGGAFYFEEYELLGDPLAFTTDTEDPFLATGADTELLQMAMTDPGLA